MKRIDSDYDLQLKLQEIMAENARLRKENSQLKTLLGINVYEAGLPFKTNPEQSNQLVTNPFVTNSSSTNEKVALFRSLFKGRVDVYPVRWEGRDGKSGYSPACGNEWKRGICGKPKVKCADCEYRDLLPVTDQVIYNHLAGDHTIGVYPLLQDETCWFIATDFDKKTWQEDSAAFLETCREMSVPAALERSRSGNGGHVWIFFEHPLSASLARKLGCAVLTRTMERRHQIGLDSYDRFFPNQDTLPKGGFGNLIALPLQRSSREKDNSVFLDDNFHPYKDQWQHLSTIKKMMPMEVEKIVQDAAHAGSIIGVLKSQTDDEDGEDPWTLPPSGKKTEKPINGPLPGKVSIIMSNLVYIEKDRLPPALINRITRIAAFQNPEFYKAQAMRLPTFGKPRVIGCADDFPMHIGLPRGCFDDVTELLKSHNIKVKVRDERYQGVPIDIAFKGELNPLQQSAVKAILTHDNGILSATTAFGKTVAATWIIAARKVNTLVLVHRKQLMDQWRERLSAFLDIPVSSIGQIGGGKDKPTFSIDVGIIQSMSRKGIVKDLISEYGQVIVDECHHISAFSFEQVSKTSQGTVCSRTDSNAHS